MGKKHDHGKVIFWIVHDHGDMIMDHGIVIFWRKKNIFWKHDHGMNKDGVYSHENSSMADFLGVYNN